MQDLQRSSNMDSMTWRIGLTLGVVMLISKLPFVLTTIGEQDQARMIVSAMVYAQDGAATLRPYALFTSPLWVLPFSLLSGFMGAAALLMLSNVMGWMAGGATATLAFVLLRQLQVSRVWAAVGAIAICWVPGAFYSSLYGYPSQFALPFLLISATAFLACLDAPPHRQLRLFLICTAAYATFVFLKIDFALAGTLLVGLAILRRRLLCRWTLYLPLVVSGVGILFWLLSRLTVRQSYFEFASTWNEFHPGNTETALGGHSLTLVYGCGWATLAIGLGILLLSLIRAGHRAQALREAVAWGVATIPLWLFWLLHPPMSTRHALPGIIVTAIFATLSAARLFPRRALVAPLWLVAVLGGNALVGSPGFDINYNPSGRLFAAVQVNQRAYAVATEIARVVSERRENVKVVYGELSQEILGGLDFDPMVEFAMACQSSEVRCRRQYGQPKALYSQDLIFTQEDGHETQVLIVKRFTLQRPFQAENTGFYAPWGIGGHVMRVPVVAFDPMQLYREMSVR